MYIKLSEKELHWQTQRCTGLRNSLFILLVYVCVCACVYLKLGRLHWVRMNSRQTAVRLLGVPHLLVIKIEIC